MENIKRVILRTLPHFSESCLFVLGGLAVAYSVVFGVFSVTLGREILTAASHTALHRWTLMAGALLGYALYIRWLRGFFSWMGAEIFFEIRSRRLGRQNINGWTPRPRN